MTMADGDDFWSKHGADNETSTGIDHALGSLGIGDRARTDQHI